MFSIVQKCIIVFILLSIALAADLKYSGIDTVSNDSRYTVLHPEVDLITFDKTHYVGGQYVFSSGKRISGDRLLLNFQDKTQFTSAVDIEALLRYPSQGEDTNIITRVEIYAAVSSEDADTHFVEGGINKSYCHILFAYNSTNYVEFEIFIYGY
ncbi:uncharacterized protein [Eurosta solidaginis]|uniref:uncharacterized protein n=1 Tax=Eurosta solidaginis TaxID=178769 RepID=UPI0035312123